MLAIRGATDDDVPEIAAIVNAAFQVERDFRAGNRTSPAEVSRLMRDGMFFVATER